MMPAEVIVAVSPSRRRLEITVRCHSKSDASCAKVTAMVKEALEQRACQVPETFPRPVCSDATGARMSVRTMNLDSVLFPVSFCFRLCGATTQHAQQTAAAPMAPEVHRRLADVRAAQAELKRQNRELRAELLERGGVAAVAAVSKAFEVEAPACLSPLSFRRPLSGCTTLCSIQEEDDASDREADGEEQQGKRRSRSLDSCSTRAGSELGDDALCLLDAGIVL